MMVLLSRMQLDERMRQDAMLQEARRARMAEEATGAKSVKASGSPKVQSQFFAQRFGRFIGRFKLQTV